MIPRAPDSLLRYLPYLMVLFLGTIWGITFSLARLATEAGAHPLGLAFWQAAGGGVVMLIWCFLSRLRPLFRSSMLGPYIVIGLLGTALPGTILFYAAPHVPAGVLAITIALVPMLTYAATWLLKIDELSMTRILGVLLGFVAILLVMLPATSLPDQSMQGWLLLALLAVCFYTGENLYVDMVIPVETDMALLLLGAMFAAACLLLPLVLQQDAFVTVWLPFDVIDWSIICMSLVSSLAYLLYLKVIQSSGAVFASMAGYVITLSGVFWGIVFFAEAHSAWIWSALILMLIGMALVTPREKAHGKPATNDTKEEENLT
ncbi:MAG: DMT family transporter [Gammaproteobacteria bacterium]|nr:DMT family transporter [Gammaproteobacteria bacterium]